MEILIAVAGLIVMVMVVSGMVLLTPSGTEPVRRAFEPDGVDSAGQGGQLSPRPVAAPTSSEPPVDRTSTPAG